MRHSSLHNLLGVVMLFIALSLSLSSCTKSVPVGGAVIEGKVTGFDKDDLIQAVLMRFDGQTGKGIVIDTIRNGHFAFRLDSLGEAKRYSVSFFRPHGKYADVLSHGPEIYLEKGVLVRIEGEGRYIYNAKIESPVKDQKLRQSFVKKMSLEDWKAWQDLNAHRYLAINELFYGEDVTEEKSDSLKRVMQEDLDALNEISERITERKIKLLQTEDIGAFALEQLLRASQGVSYGMIDAREVLLGVYERLSDEQKATDEGMQTINFLNPAKKVQAGAPLPSYDYIDKDGRTVHLSDMKGKWILMDFWSRGCGPCIKAIPEIGALGEEHRDHLAVVSINVDKETVWKEASLSHGISWNDWNDPNGTSGSIRSFGTGGLPTFVLVSPEGIIEEITSGYGEGSLRRLLGSHIGQE